MEAWRFLAARYAAEFPAEAARRLDPVPAPEVAAFLSDLDPVVAVGVVDSMLPARAASAFEVMGADPLSSILGSLSVARCVLVLRLVPEESRGRMLALFPAPTALEVERHLRFPEGTAGGLAAPIPAVLHPGMSVGDAERALHGVSDPYAYVVDGDYTLVGVMHRQELAAGDSGAVVGSLMTTEVIRLHTAVPQSAVVKHPAWLRHDPLPVVDDAGVLVGVIRHKSLRRLAAGEPASAPGRRAPLAEFLELGELYWVTLATMVGAMAGRTGTVPAEEVEHGS